MSPHLCIVQAGMDAVIVDTAGRLQIDEAMMAELAAVKAAVQPTDTLLVVDAMTGQEAATLVKAFNDAASITGGSLKLPQANTQGQVHHHVGGEAWHLLCPQPYHR